MAFDWTEYLKIARFVQSQGNKRAQISAEAAQRCAVSRAYYAAFCYARNYARDNYKFQPHNKPDDHRNLQEFYVGISKNEVADALLRLRQWRNKCDYDDRVTKLPMISAGAITNAQYVIDNA